jgi:hypothetical protein
LPALTSRIVDFYRGNILARPAWSRLLLEFGRRSAQRPHETVLAGSERTPDAGHVMQAVNTK